MFIVNKMARVVAVFNQKGGVGKTTTAMNLSAYLGMFGKRTLLVDFDSQFNATVGLGTQHGQEETIYHALLGGKSPESAIKQTYLSNLHIVPASSELAGALIELVNLPEREFYLRRFIDNIRDRYDFIFVDLGPSLNLLTINGLLASDEVIVPIQCEYYSLEGLSQVLQTLELVRNNLKHDIKISGALLTMYDRRERLSREIAKEIRKRFPYNVYEVEIPRSVSLAEAPSFKKPIMLYAPQSPGAIAYERLAREVLRQGGEEAVTNAQQAKHYFPDAAQAVLTKVETIEGIKVSETEEPIYSEDPMPLILHYHEG